MSQRKLTQFCVKVEASLIDLEGEGGEEGRTHFDDYCSDMAIWPSLKVVVSFSSIEDFKRVGVSIKCSLEVVA